MAIGYVEPVELEHGGEVVRPRKTELSVLFARHVVINYFLAKHSRHDGRVLGARQVVAHDADRLVLERRGILEDGRNHAAHVFDGHARERHIPLRKGEGVAFVGLLLRREEINKVLKVKRHADQRRPKLALAGMLHNLALRVEMGHFDLTLCDLLGRRKGAEDEMRNLRLLDGVSRQVTHESARFRQ